MISVLLRNTASKASDFNQRLYYLFRKPRVFLFWLGKAYWAQLVLILILLIFPVFMPQYVDHTLEKLYPPVTEKHLFGLIKTKKPNPALAERQQQLKLAIWGAGVGIVFLLFWLDIPRALRRAASRARERESEADSMLATQPSRSILLYRSAIAMASDPEYEQQLVAKLDKLDQQLSQIANIHTRHTDPHHTYVLSDDEIHEVGKVKHIANDRYQLETELGKGAMGVVYHAHDTVLDRHVAIKELAIHLLDKQELRDRFQQEAKALARLTHSNIVQVYDFLLENHRACIVMEFVDGFSLDDYLKEKIKLPLQQSLRIATQMAEAMAYAHKRGVIHRDFKPGNVLLTSDLTPKITDFGLAKISESSVETLTGTIMGSPAFMSPEQALGNSTDARSDIYSLGITFYKMFTTQFPFEGDAMDVMAKQINCIPVTPREINADIPVAINTLIMKMMEKNPADRLQSMDEVLACLLPISAPVLVDVQ